MMGREKFSTESVRKKKGNNFAFCSTHLMRGKHALHGATKKLLQEQTSMSDTTITILRMGSAMAFWEET